MGKFEDKTTLFLVTETYIQLMHQLQKELSQYYSIHTTYSWNIKWQKCAGMGINGFIFKKINGNENIKTIKNPGSRLEVAC